MKRQRRTFALGGSALGLLITTNALATAPARPQAAPSQAVTRARPSSPSLSDRQLLALRERVAAATVVVPAKSCAGAVVSSTRLVLTAAHCIPEGAYDLDVVLRDGQRIAAKLEHLDRDTDTALLELDEAARVTPLELAADLPRAGDRVLFVGRVDRKSQPQVARVTKLASCPSLPDVKDAVFTTVKAKPGDSGAPIVDDQLRIVGLIHGGAACHIAAPTAHLALQLGLAEGTTPATAQPSTPAAPSVAPSTPVAPSATSPAAETHQWGPLVLEKTPNGFRFELKFGWKTPSRK